MEDMEDKDTKNYEIGFLVKEEGTAEEISRIVVSYKATILNENKITKIQSAAYFGSLSFSLAPQDIQKLSDALKINAKILRFLITTPVASAVPKATTPPVRTTRKIPPLIKPSKQIPTIKKIEPVQTLSNEALEKKLEEILK